MVGAEVVAEFEENPELLAGFRVQVGSKVFDGSLVGQVDRLSRHTPHGVEQMQIKAAEIADIIRRQIEGHETTIDMSEVGTVISVGDGIARVYGLDDVMAGELLELPHDVFGLALNLEEDNVGCVLMGEVHLIREGDEVKRTGRILDIPVGPEPGRPGGRPARPTARRQGPDRRQPSATRSSASRPAWSTGSR